MNEIMYVKLIFQILGTAFCGVISGLKTARVSERFHLHSGSIVFFIGTIAFWTIPRSVDLSVLHYYAHIIMLCNLFFAGFFLGTNLKHMSFVLKMALGIYGLSMFLTTGLVYYSYESLLCAVYTIEMQNLTGKIMLQIFPFAGIFFIYRLFENFRKMSRQ
ncbi:MAG: hypothetical protein OEV66_01605 [Spirochaetia bacterium]|nr:hypothetical protein [Spirochaetia bacterium]